ncbi:hypothetical protein ACHWQZ_G017444 [Mnemiopsis leidyi]
MDTTRGSSRKQEEAAQWVLENATTGMLPSEILANEGGEMSSFFMNDQDFNSDILSVSSDGEEENTRRLQELLKRPEREDIDQLSRDDPPFVNTRAVQNRENGTLDSVSVSRNEQYENDNCCQAVFHGTPRRFLVNSSGPGPRRYVIDSNDIGKSHYKLRLPGFSEDLDIKIVAHPQFANDASKILQDIDSMLRRQHEDLERRVMDTFDRHLN